MLPGDDDDELAELFAYRSEDSRGEDTQQYFDNPNAGFEEDTADPAPESSAFAAIDDDGFDPFDIPVEDESFEVESALAPPEERYDDSPSFDEPVYKPVQEQAEEPESAPEPEPSFESYEEPQVQSRWASTEYVDPAPTPIYEASTPVYEPEPEPAAVHTPPELSPVYEQQRSAREEEPVAPAVEEPAVQSRRRINIPSESDQIQDVQRIVEILDVYRSLKPGEMKDQVYSLITMDNEPPESEAQVVVKALRAQPLLFETIRALREAKNTDPVERVFYVLELPEDVFYNLGIMAIVFTDQDPINEQQTKTNYARQLVQIIESLEGHVMSVVENTESVLRAAVGHDDE